MNDTYFNVGDILQNKFHVELNGGKFDPIYPTIFVKEISKDGKTVAGLKHYWFKKAVPILIGEPFTGCNDLAKFYVKIL